MTETLRARAEIIGVDVEPDQIDRRIYHEQSVLDRENVAIFQRSWQYICHESELSDAGDFANAMIAGQPILVARDKSGSLSAMQNACTHRGAMLTTERRGHCSGFLRCMYHGWSFDLGGRLVGVPYKNAYGDSFDNGDYNLKKVHIDTAGGMVFAAIDPMVPSLAEFLGEAAEHVERYFSGTEVIGRFSWTYTGNWKLWHENFRDNYHPQFVHKVVKALGDYGGPEPPGTNLQLDFGHAIMRWPIGARPNFERYAADIQRETGLEVDVTDSGRFSRPPETMSDGAPPHHAIFTLFPNFDFQYLAGATAMVIQVVTPLSTDRTRIELSVLGHAGEPDDVRKFRLEQSTITQGSWGKVSADDTEAALRTHLGTKTTDTPFSNMGRGTGPGKEGTKYDEYSLRSFYSAWRHYMAAGAD